MSDPSETPLPTPHPPRQARSHATLARLLDAAEAVLEAEGFERATVPAIARRAELSVGVVYRRFPDKDALLLAVYERFFAQRLAEAERLARSDALRGVPLYERLSAIVSGTVVGQRRYAAILRALDRYAQLHRDPRVRRRIDELNAASLDAVRALLADAMDQVRHPEPERALSFGMLVVSLALRGIVVQQAPGIARYVGPEESLGAELTRVLAGYLGVPGP